MSTAKPELLQTNLNFDKNDLIAITVSALEEQLTLRKEELEDEIKENSENLDQIRNSVGKTLTKHIREASKEKVAAARKALQAMATKGVKISLTMDTPYLSIDVVDEDCDEDEDRPQKIVAYCDYCVSATGYGNGYRDGLNIRLCYALPKEVEVLQKEIETCEQKHQDLYRELHEVNEALQNPGRYERKARAALANRSLAQRGEEGQAVLEMLQDIVKPKTRQSRQITAAKK